LHSVTDHAKVEPGIAFAAQKKKKKKIVASVSMRGATGVNLVSWTKAQLDPAAERTNQA